MGPVIQLSFWIGASELLWYIPRPIPATTSIPSMASSRVLSSPSPAAHPRKKDRPSHSTTAPAKLLLGNTKNEPEFRRSLITRRDALSLFILPFAAGQLVAPAEARERRNRKVIPSEDYLISPDGLKYYDLLQGKGPVAEKGATVQVHFDCIYRGITAVSSRESKLLAGNRIISQPYEFTIGSTPGKERKRNYVDNANGLFSAQAAPKPPAAMYKVTEGMRVGGKRTVIVPPEAGYGGKGMNEIPPGASFELNLELLEVVSPPAK